MPGYDPVRDAGTRPDRLSPLPTHRSASIADLITASEMTDTDRERSRYSRDAAVIRPEDEHATDRSMSRSSSASGHGHSTTASLHASSSQSRLSPQLPRQSPRTERSPSMAHLLNEGHAGAIVDRPRSGSHSSITSQLSQQASTTHHPHYSPLSHGAPQGYTTTPSHHQYARESPSFSLSRTGPSPLPGKWPPSPGAFSSQHPQAPPLPPPSNPHRSGSSPALPSLQTAERLRYVSHSGSTLLGSGPRPIPASLGYGSTSSSPSSAVHAHLHPSPSHRFVVPELRSPDSRRVPLPLSPSSGQFAPHRSSYSSGSHPDLSGADERERMVSHGDMLPPTSVSPRRGSVSHADTSAYHRYQPSPPGNGFPQTPGHSVSADPYYTTLESRYDLSASPRRAQSKHEGESVYFPQVTLEADDDYTSASYSGSLSAHQAQSRFQHGRDDSHTNDGHYRPYEPVTTPGSVQRSTSSGRRDPSVLPTLPSPIESPLAGNTRHNATLSRRSASTSLQEESTKPRPIAKTDISSGIKEDAYSDSANAEPQNVLSASSESPMSRNIAQFQGDSAVTDGLKHSEMQETSAAVLTLESEPSTDGKPPAALKAVSAEQVAPDQTQRAEDSELLPRYVPTSRVSPPKMVMRPIQIEEIDSKRNRCRNPLRLEWEQKSQTDSRDPLDQILRDFHSKLPLRAIATEKKNDQESQDSARKRPLADTLEDAKEVASHYNKRREVGIHGREESPIIGLRKFNNWIKSVLVGSFARGRDATMDGRVRPRGGRVLDLGCGKGGDLKKWEKVDPSAIVGADIAAVSIQQAIARHQDNGNRYKADFFAFDCFSTALSDVIPRHLLDPMFDNVTLQFCMHYAWESLQKARMMLDNVSRYLRPGGIFIGTIPDSVELRGRLSESSTLQDRSFGNQYYKVVFDQIDTFPPFGNRYTFFLEDAVENVPEYVVEFEVFEQLAHEAGLRCIYRKNFADIFADGQAHPEFGRLLERMKVRSRDGSLAIDEDMWLAATLYLGFAFEKM